MQNTAPLKRTRLASHARYCCDRCGRTYSRRDHLARHLQSHSSEPSFVCTDCGKGFSRRFATGSGPSITLFLICVQETSSCANSATHSLDQSDSGPRPSSGSAQALSRRVYKACKPCAEAKVKCHDQKPCRRYLRRGIPCIFEPFAPAPTSSVEDPLGLYIQPQGASASHSSIAENVISDNHSLCTTGSPIVDLETVPEAFMDDTMMDMWCMTDACQESFHQLGNAFGSSPRPDGMSLDHLLLGGAGIDFG